MPNERTSLAWRRTALSLLVAAATMAKLTASEWGAAAGLWLLAGVPGSLAILVWSSRSYHARRAAPLHAPVPAVLLASATTVAIGVLSLVLVLG